MHLHGLRLSCCCLVAFDSSNLLRRQQRWDAAVRTLEATEEARSRVDRRSKLASLVGLYVDADHDHDRGGRGGGPYGVDLVVAVQPDRSCGRKLVFIDRVTEQLLGFVLLETTSHSKTCTAAAAEQHREDEDCIVSTIRGIKVEEWARGRGYSTLFLSVWLKLCLQGGIVPATVSINKPLLALALCRFGFAPAATGSGRDVDEAVTNKKRKRRSVRKTPISIEIGTQSSTEGKVEIYCD